MKSTANFNSVLDKYLIGGLGCALIVLCVLAATFFVFWRNPPRPLPTAPSSLPGSGGTAVVGSGVSPTALFPFGTPSLQPTGLPPLTPTQAVQETTAVPPAAGVPSAVSPYDNSPSTGKIVFTCFVDQIDQICLMNADGSERRQLTDFEGTSFYASLSPDGQTIYFSSRRTGSFEIYSMNLRGRGLERLTRNIGNLYAPERSPTNDRIVFTNNTGGQQRIWIMREDGNNPHPISDGPEDIDPTWSPDGEWIAFASARTGQRQLYVMDRDGSEVRQITDLPNMGGRSSWSPDGTRLTFYNGPEGDHNIYVINVDGSGLIQLTNGGDNLGPSWSPDGDWITFTSFRDGNNEIYMVHPDGTGLTRLTDSPISDWQPRWGP